MEDIVLKEIAEKATSLTEQNKIRWKSFDNSSDYFTSKIGDKELAIFNPGLRYVFQVFDANRNVLGTLNEEAYLKGTHPGLPWNLTTNINFSTVGMPILPVNYGLEKLFEIAKKSALEVDKRLYDLLDKMKNM